MAAVRTLPAERPAQLALNAALALAALVTLFPLLWMVSVSLMAPGESQQVPPPLLPARATLDNYHALFVRLGIGRYALNSVVIATCATLLALGFNVMAGYGFAKLRFAGRAAALKLVVAAMLVPAQVAMLPLFLLLKSMGLVNTWAGVLVPALAGAFGIFLVRQHALSIPDELLDAARMDGAGEWRIFRSVVLPLLRPILVTLGLFTFLGTWNDFMWPLVILSDEPLQTLPVALAGLSREHVQDTELMMAGAVLTVLPVLAAFLALQRHYISGMTMGSVKG